MIGNYLKIAYRTLLRYKAYAVINILGLTLGLAGAIIIFLLVKFHMSFDNFHTKTDRIQRIVTKLHFDDVAYTAGIPLPMSEEIRNNYSFIEKVATCIQEYGTTISLLNTNGSTVKKFKEEESVVFVEPEYFSILDFPAISGNPSKDLKDPNVVFLTKKYAMKYFGTLDVIGKTIKINNILPLKVVGVLQDIPNNSDRIFNIFVSYKSLPAFDPRYKDKFKNWNGINSDTHCFVLLKDASQTPLLAKAMIELPKKVYNKADVKIYEFKLLGLRDIHFASDYDGKAPKAALISFALIGLFLIVTACINFINLATAQALKRSKEVGVRKVLGSTKTQLFWQFITETSLISICALFLAYALAYVAFPYLNGWLDDLTGYQMVFSEITDFKVYIALILTILVVVVFSGFYPALVLAGFNPVTALKGKVSTQNVGGVSIRKSLVVAQFVISQILIISTIVISTQMDFFQNTNLGFKHDAVVVLSVPTQDNIKLATMKSRISELSAVKNFCYESGAPASGSNNQTSFTFDNREKAEPYQVNVKAVDEDFIKTYKIPLVCGRNITHSDTLRDVIINEVLVKKLGLKSPLDAIGKKVRVSGRSDGTIVGVIKSFHVYSLHSEIPPLAIYSQLNRYSECGINVSMTDMPNTLSAIEKIWNETFPEYVFDYHFLDQNIKEFYSLENLMLRLIKAFSLLAIFIGCLGLYGLVSFMVTQKNQGNRGKKKY
ncbi:ABC transporter permease [Pseudarcicella hirudinis]|uniref:ABC transporter permease n=1 Tax=Pseudarcicella hirudinis TaxID=1079859 RepID=UPI0035E7E677